jgi:hypothetical protein
VSRGVEKGKVMAAGKFAPGFRFSILDGVVLVVGTISSFVLGQFVWWWGFSAGFVLAHFFLFCNVVRLARPLELTWAAVFLALAVSTVMAGMPGWPVTAALSVAATLGLVAVEMRKPSYHGAGWRKINPRLPEWWESQTAEQE